MRTEIYLNRLVSAAQDKSIAPEKLAKAFEATMAKIAEINPRGEEAINIMHRRFVRDSFMTPRSGPRIAARSAETTKAPVKTRARKASRRKTVATKRGATKRPKTAAHAAV